MKRVMTILAAAALTSTLLGSAAEARGFDGGGHMGGFGGGVFTVDGQFVGRVGGGEIGLGEKGFGFRERMMREYGPGSFDHLGCYYPDEAPRVPPWPPYCN